jgi:hypothetical protein
MRETAAHFLVGLKRAFYDGLEFGAFFLTFALCMATLAGCGFVIVLTFAVSPWFVFALIPLVPLLGFLSKRNCRT